MSFVRQDRARDLTPPPRGVDRRRRVTAVR